MAVISTYLHEALENLNGVVDIMESKLQNKEFDAIIVSGTSGLLVGPALAARMNKKLIIVRKSESSHSSHMVEGERNVVTAIILDDVISSGETVDRMRNAISSSVFFRHVEIVGYALWHQYLICAESLFNKQDIKPGTFLIHRDFELTK